MSRKPNPSEAAVSNKDDTNLPDTKAKITSLHSLSLQSQIAEALGLPAADLLNRSALGNDTQDASYDGQGAEMALTRDCLELVEAFVRVVDPKERQRLLKMVRDAAQMNRHEEMPGF